MGRRQIKKGERETVQYHIDTELAPIIYTKLQFEDFKSTIATFANALVSKNKNGEVEVTRRHVVALWTLSVQRVYSAGNPKRDELLDQVSARGHTALEDGAPLTN